MSLQPKDWVAGMTVGGGKWSDAGNRLVRREDDGWVIASVHTGNAGFYSDSTVRGVGIRPATYSDLAREPVIGDEVVCVKDFGFYKVGVRDRVNIEGFRETCADHFAPLTAAPEGEDGGWSRPETVAPGHWTEPPAPAQPCYAEALIEFHDNCGCIACLARQDIQETADRTAEIMARGQAKIDNPADPSLAPYREKRDAGLGWWFRRFGGGA